MSDNDDGDDEMPTCIGGGPLRPPTGADRERIDAKLRKIPTIEELFAEGDPHALSDEQTQLAEKVAMELINKNPSNDAQLKVAIKEIMKKFKTDCKKSVILQGYKNLRAKQGSTMPKMSSFLEQYLLSKAPRSQSGVLVVTVFTSATPEDEFGNKQNFSCKWNCYYCPNEPGQPRSYLLNEPGVRRANRLDFDAVRQFTDRVGALYAIGHPADKVELLVLGGTWESYPPFYREKFIRDLFFAANTFFDPFDSKRQPWSLLEEQTANETAQCKIIGLTLETRPDTINHDMIVNLRRLGCTRVQIGVQHTDDSILSLINREATRSDVVRAIRLLKDSCFKVDIHLMPDLPGASPDVDRKMFDDVLYSPELQADQWKIYPCMTTPFSVIQKWLEEGRYRSYGLDELIEVILYAKRRVHPWIRLNRVVRDIPVEYVLEGVEVSNLRQLLQKKLEAKGEWCKCIRCREVKGDKEVQEKLASSKIITRNYDASNGKEIFISCETPTEQTTLFGFLRLRFPPSVTTGSELTPFPELRGSVALIRELHVYGNLVVAKPQTEPTMSPGGLPGAGGTSSQLLLSQQQNTSTMTPAAAAPGGGAAQHAGVGRRLLFRAEEIAALAGYRFIAVISGVGVRNYYRKRGYELLFPERGAFMIKALFQPKPTTQAGLAALEQKWAADQLRLRRRRTMMIVNQNGQPLLQRCSPSQQQQRQPSQECERDLRSCERMAQQHQVQDLNQPRDQAILILFLAFSFILAIVLAAVRIKTGKFVPWF